MAFIAEWVGSAIIDNLVSRCFSYLEACSAAGGMQDELERLRYALLQVQAVLTAVDEGAPVMVQNKALDMWQWELRDAVENAEDVLGELEYCELQKTIRDRDDKVRGIPSNYKRKFDSFVNGIFSDDTLINRLREAVKGLDRVIAGMGPFLQLVTGSYGAGVKRQKLEDIMKARETGSLVIKSEVLGRDKERDQIVEWLIKPADVDVDVSPFTIVGLGGLGKTTLAQLVNCDERVKGYFGPTMWVCVSQDFDAAAIIRKILQCVSNENFGDKFLDALQNNLKEKLTSKRFLLILDDVWNDDSMTEWENLVAPLKSGQRGSKILLTTRMGSVADMAAKVMKCKRESLNLNELEESDCMSLFNKHAFLGVNPGDYKNLQLIGEQIVKKLGGSPLAIKIMGGILNNSMDYEDWRNILEEDIMKLQEGKDGIMTILRLSYDHLPANLQLCFRYCSLFPQDHVFKRKELVNMWIGSGLIPQSIRGRQRRPEDIGKDYLNLLTRKSFFTCKTLKIKNNPKEYFMHDLLHDLAQSVSLGECIRVGGDVPRITIPRTVRHLSIEMVNFLSFREISNLKNVRTLIVSDKEDNKHNADRELEYIKVIKRFKKLRLLILDVYIHSQKLLDEISNLIHLRYLSLLYWRVVNESVEYDGLTNLVNLRLLDVPYYVIENIPYISKLPFIHKLEKFSVREESGYKISELKNLGDLRHLHIRELENVRSSEEAMEAKLNEKEYLKSLTLQWSEDRSNSAEADEQLLDNVCPPINLKKMFIRQYQGAKSPCWMTNLSLANLTSIELTQCKGWEHLPPLGQFSSLKYLNLQGLHAIKQIDCSLFESNSVCAFPSLKDFWLRDMPNLEEWIGVDDGCMFPQLHYMDITNCPNLREIPTLPYCLREMKISEVGLTALPTVNQDYTDNNRQEHSQGLERLVIEQCEKLEYVPTEFFQKFDSLKSLRIDKCPKLTKRRISDIQLPSTLNQLTIGSCGDLEVPLLQLLPNLTSLTWLELADCASITSLPPAQVCARWTMLSYLIIKNCKGLSSFGGIQALVSLRQLEIRGCDKLIEVALLQQPPFPNDVGQKKNAADCFLKNGGLSIDHNALLLMEPLRSLSSISRLTFSDASQLTSLFPEEWLLQNHAALMDLKIWNAVSLQSLPQSMTKLCSLKWLEIRNAVSLQSLPQSMTKLCSLHWLEIRNANLIRSLPDLPTSLRHLHILGCHPVLKERCQENVGLDWPKIANIPNVTIAE